MTHEKLTPPLISSDYTHITCIRPKRTGGPRIAREEQHGKIIIHNYGHGGFGWSLLPGSVLHSISLMTPQPLHTPITVVGAGCMGLLTAVLLHQQGYTVTIIAEQTTSLTSHKAAGSASVIAIKASRELQPLMDKLACDSYQFYQQAYQQQNPLFMGIKPLPVYMIHHGNPTYRYPVIDAGIMPPGQAVTISFGKTSYEAMKYQTFFIETGLVMQALMDYVTAHAIPLIQKKVLQLTEIDTNVIFNCSGLGARAWHDQQLVPVQGHLLMMQHQPLDLLQYILYAHIKVKGKTREISWTPKAGGMLGGAAFNFQDSLTSNSQEAQEIIERARYFFYGE